MCALSAYPSIHLLTNAHRFPLPHKHINHQLAIVVVSLILVAVILIMEISTITLSMPSTGSDETFADNPIEEQKAESAASSVKKSYPRYTIAQRVLRQSLCSAIMGYLYVAVSWISVYIVSFALVGLRAFCHRNIYTSLYTAHRDAVSDGEEVLSLWRRKWMRLFSVKNTHLILDVGTSKRILSDRDSFEKVGLPSAASKDRKPHGSVGLGGSMLTSGDDSVHWEGLKCQLLKTVVPNCIAAAKQLSIRSIEFPCGVDVDLYEILFDWVITYQYNLFLNYKVELEHPQEKGYFFRDVLDRSISGGSISTGKDRPWLDKQVHRAMEASTLCAKDPEKANCSLGSIFSTCPPENFYHNTFMIFVAVTPVFALFWSIVEHLLDPDLSAEECFANALRTRSPVPVLYLRKAKLDVQVGNKTTINKGDHVYISPFLVNEEDTGISFGYGHHTCLMKYYNKAVWPRFLVNFFAKYSIEVTKNLSFIEKPRQHQLAGNGSAYARPAESVRVVLTEKNEIFEC